MFDLSSKTQVNRKFKLTELYKMIEADKTVKADAKKITSVTLTNVLSSDTLNLDCNGVVKEIYVFEVVLEDKTVPTLFISSLDKSINLHTVFVLTYENEKCLYGAYKEVTEKGVKLGKYYSTEWTADSSLIALPLNVTNIDDIYTAIIDELIPITARVGESTKAFVERYDNINKLTKEIERKQKQVDNERQPKKRFELNDELKKLKKELSVQNGN